MSGREISEAGWSAMSEAPYSKLVEVKVATGMTFLARFEPGAAMDDEGELCDQWQAEHEGEHPPCWSDGACWESNDDCSPSLLPTRWRPAPEHAQHLGGEERS